jgi:hypothetical protein
LKRCGSVEHEEWSRRFGWRKFPAGGFGTVSLLYVIGTQY